MSAARFVELAGPIERFVRKLADRLQEGVALLVEAHEALLDERLQDVELGFGHLLRSVERPAAGEDREPPESLLLLGREQLITPGDRAAQGSLALRQVAGAAREQWQGVLQPRQDLGCRERLDPSGRQLERKRQMVEAAADRQHVLPAGSTG
jgi:hypothetical protein